MEGSESPAPIDTMDVSGAPAMEEVKVVTEGFKIRIPPKASGSGTQVIWCHGYVTAMPLILSRYSQRPLPMGL